MARTARKFLANPELTAEITRIDLKSLEKFAYILHQLTNTKLTDLETFETYSMETAQLYVRLYLWHYMPCNRP